MYRCICTKEFSNKVDLENHKKNGCQDRYFPCEFCHTSVASYDMGDHLFQCANKTVKCSMCHKYIQRAIYNYHSEHNCIDLDEDNTYNNYSVSSNIHNNTNVDDDILIPCEFCEEQVQLSDIQFHMQNCLRNSNYPRQTFPKRVIDYSTNEAETTSEPNIDTKSNDDSKLKNSSLNDQQTIKEGAVSLLHERTSDVQDLLYQNYFRAEVDRNAEKLQFNILIIGSPRVGKSQLINAICGRENAAETSPSLNSCTAEVKRYTLEDNQKLTPGVKPFQINFYDTPGIESWTNENGQTTMLKFIADKDPVCLIYCAAPGTFADLKQLRPVFEFCRTKQIFCALVCTNMWSSPNRKTVIQEFEEELRIFGDRNETLFAQERSHLPHKVIVFGNSALCTMVNSIEYYDPDLSSERKPVQGIDELIHCIMNELDQEKLLGWCNAVLYRRSYWEKISQKVDGFYSTYVSDKLPSSMSVDQIAIDFALRVFKISRK